MSAELETAWTIATHLAEMVTAHTLMEAGKRPLQRGARAVVDWLSAHLPDADKPKLEAVTHSPAPGPAAQMGLAVQINAMLEAHPDLLPQIRTLLAETKGADSSQHQTVGDNSTANQVQGSNISINR